MIYSTSPPSGWQAGRQTVIFGGKIAHRDWLLCLFMSGTVTVGAAILLEWGSADCIAQCAATFAPHLHLPSGDAPLKANKEKQKNNKQGISWSRDESCFGVRFACAHQNSTRFDSTTEFCVCFRMGYGCATSNCLRIVHRSAIRFIWAIDERATHTQMKFRESKTASVDKASAKKHMMGHRSVGSFALTTLFLILLGFGWCNARCIMWVCGDYMSRRAKKRNTKKK